jgi:hypothetical protein
VALSVKSAKVRGVLMNLIRLIEHLASKDFRRGLPARRTNNTYYLNRYGKCYERAEQLHYTVKL